MPGEAEEEPEHGGVIGSTIDWETMQLLPAQKEKVAAAKEEDDKFSDIPF